MDVRPIDANALREEFKRGVNVVKGICNVSQILHNIDTAPTLDYEHVVRCKDCKHRIMNCGRIMCKRTAKKVEYKTLSIIGYFDLIAVTENHFCSYGAKMTEEVNNVTKL